MKNLYVRRILILITLSNICISNLWGQKIKSVPHRSPFTAEHERGTLSIRKLDVLNSPFAEKNLSISANGELLFFHTQRGGQSWSSHYINSQGDSTHDGDIWIARRINREWLPPTPLPYGLNTSANEDEPLITANGKFLYYQSWNFLWEDTNGPYYKKKKRGRKWKRSNGLGSGITDFFREFVSTDGMALSPDEKTFIVAAGEPNQADLDIYWSRKGAFGWSVPERLGISTSGDERSLYLAKDGRTLYFASDGYGGYGGLDIFKTTLNDDGTYGEIINMGTPINSEENDYGFVISSDKQEGFFIREGDIYTVDLQEASAVIKPSDS